MNLDDRRRFFAEEIEVVANLKTPALVDALATVPRERYLRPGPWIIRSEADFQSAPRATPDADPKHLYHNVGVAIDHARQLFNGAPSLLAMAIDNLALTPGKRVLHLGTGTGYYTALMATCVGETGSVLGIEVDEALASEARANLATLPWVDVTHADGQEISGPFDAMLINAGVTHPQQGWIDALADGGRMVLPITAAMGSTIGKGLLVLLTRAGDEIQARLIGFVAIYSAVGLRDPEIEQRLAVALRTNPFPRLQRLRRDPHEPESTCWLHAEGACLSVS